MAQTTPDSSEAGQIHPGTSLTAGIFPLSFGQESLWVLDQISPGSAAYNIPEAWRFHGQLDCKALEFALNKIVERHESLRTIFTSQDGKPAQRILANQPLSLERVDFQKGANPEAEVQKWLRAEAARAFDLSRGPLFRAALGKLSENEHVLFLNLHHIVSDAWSLNILLRDLAEIYSSVTEKKALNLPELPIQFADFAEWQREKLDNAVQDSYLEFWRTHLGENHEPIDLRTDFVRPRILSGKGDSRFYSLTKELTAQLQETAKKLNSSLFITLFAAFNSLLARHALRDEIVIGTPLACRERIETEDLVGFFVNTLTIRTDLRNDPPFAKVVGAVRENLIQASARQEMPVEKLVEGLSLERKLNQNALYRVVFGWQTGTPHEWQLPGLGSERIELHSGTSKFDWTVLVTETSKGLRFRFEYSTELFSAQTIDGVMQQFEMMLHSIVANPQVPISRLAILSPNEKAKVMVDWNQTKSEYAAPSIHRAFEKQAARDGQAIALRFQGCELTYQELNRRANRLARFLCKAGIKPQSRVGLAVGRSFELVIGLLAILKAGAAYLPLDGSFPGERLKLMMEEGDAKFLLHDKSFVCDGFRLDEKQIVCIEDEARWKDESPEDLGLDGSLESEAYLCFTSGSTGRPKGAVIPHRGVLRLVTNPNYATFTPKDIFLQLASISFDASTLEIWGALLNGGTLVIFPPHAPSLEELARTIQNEKVSVLWLTAGLFHQLSEAHLSQLAGVRHLLAGGEALSVAHVIKATQQLPNTQLINGYGPTENTTFTCCYSVPKNWQGAVSVPIGRPISNTRVYILDALQQPVPPGIPGELYAAGDGLAQGYAGRNDLTDAKFVKSPFPEIESSMLYRTGDLARWLHDGNVEFLGRLDTQLKIRGFRVEPGEVENHLLQHEGIEQALVFARKDKSGNNQLIAYIVSRAGGRPISADLREFLAKRLPAYMVPSWFVALDSFPLTNNGKVDRARLPLPELVAQAENGKAMAPRNATERTLHDIWSGLLGNNSFGVEDNFFHLGGHSLLATQVISRVVRELGIELQVRSVFESPTIAGLAREVEQAQSLGPSAETRKIAPAAGRIKAEDLLARIDELSDAEVEKLLSDPELKQVLT